jgi:hypothetical protein
MANLHTVDTNKNVEVSRIQICASKIPTLQENTVLKPESYYKTMRYTIKLINY